MPPAPLTILTLMGCPPNMLPTLLTLLTLVQCTPDMLPALLTILLLVGCPPNILPTPLVLTLPYYIHSVQWLVGVHNERICRNMLSGLLCQHDLRKNWSVYSQCCG
ncbi:hypothetical protein O181_118191 [Austropuccinia psidii MF-1]|uniref:Uncharacterized protein n=1 Tax=Austropuccinia psidii MF-1 TaxID=1389203 RepID=A0A9Q3KDE4_9BASI|nr:hypothetical protein [Austropuccinia psidii MF-1]